MTKSKGTIRKCGLFFAVIVCAALAVGCVCGAYLFVSEEFYTTPKDRILTAYDQSRMQVDSMLLMNELLYPDYYAHTPDHRMFFPASTNLRYILTDGDGNVASANVSYTTEDGVLLPIYEETGEPEPSPGEDAWAGWTEIGWYVTTYDDPTSQGEKLRSFYSYPNESLRYSADGTPLEPASVEVYTFRGRVASGLPEEDIYRFVHTLYSLIYELRYAVYPIGAVSLILCVLCFILLMSFSARRPGQDGLFPGPFHRVPFDLLAAAGMSAVLFLAYVLHELWESSGNLFLFALFIGVGGVTAACVLLGLSMSAAARIKTGTILTNTVVCLVLRTVWRIMKATECGAALSSTVSP